MPGQSPIIRTGDQAIFNPAFGTAIVVVLPGVITGSGRAQLDGITACVLGDEASVVVQNVAYVSPPFVTPSVGTLTIASLNPDQIAMHTTIDGKPAILLGSQFNALFTVSAPAMQPSTPPVPDPVPVYPGSGQFVTTNARSVGS
jgi:hypothetical protein